MRPRSPFALVTRTPERPRQPLASHLGRITTYRRARRAGCDVQRIRHQFLRNEVLQTAWLLLPNLLLLFSALYLMGFQRAYAPVEKVGRRVWQGLRARAVGRRHAAAFGATFARRVVGHTALRHDLQRARSGGASGAAVRRCALVMAAFGASTLPVLLALGMLSQSAVRRLRPKPRDAGWGRLAAAGRVESLPAAGPPARCQVLVLLLSRSEQAPALLASDWRLPQLELVAFKIVGPTEATLF